MREGSEPKLKVQSSNRQDSRAFTLLEMMMVVMLILVLATFAMPTFQTVIVRGREAVLREDLFTLRNQIDRFTHDNERGPISLDELVEKEYMGSVPTDPFTGSNQTWQVDIENDSLSVDGSAPLGIGGQKGGQVPFPELYPLPNREAPRSRR